MKMSTILPANNSADTLEKKMKEVSIGGQVPWKKELKLPPKDMRVRTSDVTDREGKEFEVGFYLQMDL